MAPQTKADKTAAAKTTAAKDVALESPLPAIQVQVDDKIYSAVKLAAIHPGGELFVKAFGGKDATDAFLSYHRREFPHAKMGYALIGDTKSNKKANADADYLELCRIIDQVLPRNKSFAPFSYYLKIAVIISAAVGLEVYMHYTGSYKWYLSAVMGWLMALIGLNIQHDANHGAISRNPWVNRILGMTQNYIGGSAIDWIHQHVVQHHIYTNDVNHDPDIAGNEYLRINPIKPLMRYHVLQHIYVFFLIAFFGINTVFESFNHIVKGSHHTSMSQLLTSNRIFESFTFFAFIARWFVLPLYQQPSVFTFLQVFPLFVVGGYYLAFFFIISHNFVGVHVFDKDDSKVDKQSFLYQQVSSSSNVGGRFLCFLNGGLNYQIEHHLFPRVSHNHYPTIAPVVREFCLKKNIPYVHFATIGGNFSSCVKHLFNMGHHKDLSDKEITFHH